MSDMDLVIQGPYTDYTDQIIHSYLNLPFIRDIIVSCWEEDPVREDTSRVKYVRSPAYDRWPGAANVNLQLTTCLAGVQATDAEFVGKMRSDQLFNEDGLINMHEFFIDNRWREKNRIFVTGNVWELVFHPKDWVYWGSRESIINLFDIPHEVNALAQVMGVNSGNYGNYRHVMMRPETYIGVHYCSRFDDRIKKMIDHPDKYLYDSCSKWDEAHKVSMEVTPKAFKCFQRKGIHFSWPRKGINVLPFDPSNEGWDEEGF